MTTRDDANLEELRASCKDTLTKVEVAVIHGQPDPDEYDLAPYWGGRSEAYHYGRLCRCAEYCGLFRHGAEDVAAQHFYAYAAYTSCECREPVSYESAIYLAANLRAELYKGTAKRSWRSLWNTDVRRERLNALNDIDTLDTAIMMCRKRWVVEMKHLRGKLLHSLTEMEITEQKIRTTRKLMKEQNEST